jgi:hypothetical protein
MRLFARDGKRGGLRTTSMSEVIRRPSDHAAGRQVHPRQRIRLPEYRYGSNVPIGDIG